MFTGVFDITISPPKNGIPKYIIVHIMIQIFLESEPDNVTTAEW
jgi:hypothetical protein